MKRMRSYPFALSVLALAAAPFFLSAATTADAAEPAAPSGPGPKSREAGGGKTYDPENVRGISRAMETFLVGIEKYKARDFAGAVAEFQSGLALNPKLAVGHLLVAEAQLALGKLEEAEQATKTAEGLTDDRHPEIRARALFAVANISERRRKSVEAEAAWRAYAQYATQHPDAGTHPLTAQTRLSYLADFIKLEKAYEGVRERIQREKKDGGPDAR